ncbi:uncharacterized protein METZ01_LOCUS79484 [marine metagenome]|uniref:Uncharacterized protein n=1 Tax=marine metagenome TaxID=408172 RepID=A0A381UES4_9ZZZZ
MPNRLVIYQPREMPSISVAGTWDFTLESRDLSPGQEDERRMLRRRRAPADLYTGTYDSRAHEQARTSS